MTHIPSDLSFIDIETTGLDAYYHEVWEVGLILRRFKNTSSSDFFEEEFVWQLPVNLGKADPVALSVGDFYGRVNTKNLYGLSEFSVKFGRLTHNTHFVGAIPSFDEKRLEKLLRSNRGCPGWHYHLIDVESMMLGWLAAKGNPVIPPWKHKDLIPHLGIDVAMYDSHTALGDARLVRDVYDRITGVQKSS